MIACEVGKSRAIVSIADDARKTAAMSCCVAFDSAVLSCYDIAAVTSPGSYEYPQITIVNCIICVSVNIRFKFCPGLSPLIRQDCEI